MRNWDDHRVWLNPPFDDLDRWIDCLCVASSSTSVCIVPAAAGHHPLDVVWACAAVAKSGQRSRCRINFRYNTHNAHPR